MERIVRSLKIIIRSERTLIERQLQLASQKIHLNIFAILVIGAGIIFLDAAGFFALQPHWGSALSALAIGGSNIALALLLLSYSKNLKPGQDVEMMEEVRDIAISEIEEEVADARRELVELKDEVRYLIKHPLDALLPSVLQPLLSSVVKGAQEKKKKKQKAVDD